MHDTCTCSSMKNGEGGGFGGGGGSGTQPMGKSRFACISHVHVKSELPV